MLNWVEMVEPTFVEAKAMRLQIKVPIDSY